MRRSATIRLAIATVLLVARTVVAQSPEVLEMRGPTPSLVRLGESAMIELVVRGPTANPAAPDLPAVEGLRFQVGSPSRQQSSSYVNGRVSRDVRVVYRVEIVPGRVGRFEVPSFEMQTGTRTQTVESFGFEVVRDVEGATESFVRVDALPSRVYVNEPVRFVFDVGVDSRVRLFQERVRQGQFDKLYVRAPWFREPEGFVAAESGTDDVANGGGGGEVRIIGWNDEAIYAAFTSGYRVGDATYSRYTFTRTLIPTAPGTVEVPGAIVVLSTAGRGRRDLFGTMRHEEKQRFVYGEPLAIEVLPVPTEGRPASYGNAVGRFEIVAGCDQSRCRVGDSIKFELVIRGRGNLEFLDPPELRDVEGFHVLGTNVTRDADAVRVTFDMTPLDEQVTELPRVTWSFFDTTPGVEDFVEVTTDPIPLVVDPAPAGGGGGLSILPGEDDAAVVRGEDDIFDMKEVPLDRPLPLPVPRGFSVRAAWVLGPWLLVAGLAFWMAARRRSRADVRGRRAAGASARFRSVLAEGDATAALVGYLADRLDTPDAAVIGPDLALRLTAAGADEQLAGETQDAIDAGTAGRYGGGTGLDAARAEALVARLEGVSLRAGAAERRVNPALLLATLLVCGAADLTAQTQGLSELSVAAASEIDPAAAYRAGDYAAAAVGFEALATRPDADRRWFYNLGNARFRQGEYAEALAAYESARLAMPRDPELLANIELCERRLDLATGEGESFLDSFRSIRDRFTAVELVWIACVANLLAAVLLIVGRSTVLRWLGVVCAVPALLLALEVLWWGPSRAPLGVVLPARLDVVAEPRDGLEPIVRLRRGVRVELLSEGDAWASVRVDDRRGYVPAEAVRAIR